MEVFQAVAANAASSHLDQAPDLDLSNVVAVDESVSTPAKKTPVAEMTGLTPSGSMTVILHLNMNIFLMTYIYIYIYLSFMYIR